MDVGGVNLATMLAHDSVADAEAQAHAASGRLGRKEGIEDAVEIGEAGAAVGDVDEDLVAEIAGFNGDFLGGGFLHGVDGIGNEVRKNDLELALFDSDDRE